MSASSPVLLKRHIIPIYVKSRELVYGLGAPPVHCLSTLEWKTQLKVRDCLLTAWTDTVCYEQSLRSCPWSTSMRKMNQISMRKSKVRLFSTPSVHFSLYTPTSINHLLVHGYCVQIPAIILTCFHFRIKREMHFIFFLHQWRVIVSSIPFFIDSDPKTENTFQSIDSNIFN